MPELPVPHDNIPDTRKSVKQSTTCDMNHKVTLSSDANASSSSLCGDLNTNNNMSTSEREGVNLLTTPVIMKECVAQGFYRNHICNEKLYLHHKAFTDIEPCALVPYTDVKVLWLESNALRELQCGRAFVRVKPPHVPNPFESDGEESESEYMICDEEEVELCNENRELQHEECELLKIKEEEEMQKDVHVDPTDDKSILAHTVGECELSQDAEQKQEEMMIVKETKEFVKTHVDKEMQTRVQIKKMPLAEMNTTNSHKIDVFSSQYRKLRQLYLHNNVLHEFPDLHQFEVLHSLNLSDNYIDKVDAHCPRFHKALRNYEQRKHELEQLNMHLSKSAQRERVEDKVHTVLTLESAQGKNNDDNNNMEDDNDNIKNTYNANNNNHDELSEKVKLYASFCTHCAVPDNNETVSTNTNLQKETKTDKEDNTSDIPRWRAKNINEPELCFRNLCSSLHTLQITNNRIASFDDCIGLVCFKNLKSLDISNNNIKDGEMFLAILKQLDRLKSLKCHGNPFVRSLPKYRKRILATCVSLLYLDDRPVFEDECRLVTAWSIGGADEEEKERNKMKSEKAEIAEKRLRDFRQMLHDHRGVHEHALVQTLLPNYSNNSSDNESNNNTNNINTEYVDSPTSSSSSDDDAYNDECNHIIGGNNLQNNSTNNDSNIISDNHENDYIYNNDSSSSNDCEYNNRSSEENHCSLDDDKEIDVNKCFIPVEEAVDMNETEMPYTVDNIHHLDVDDRHRNINDNTGPSAHSITRVLSSNGDHISRSAWLRNRDASCATNSDVNDMNDENGNDDVYIPSVER